MSTIRRVSPREAHDLVQREGYVYLDVRTEEEFAQGHPKGAWNVPFLLSTPSGMAPNPDFLTVVRAHFDTSTRIIVGCAAGGRSARAAEALAQAGYTNVVDQRAGWSGCRDPFGQIVEAGWAAEGLPSATRAEPGRSHAELRTGTAKDRG
ncbi:MAG: rhodanese-like domain-containing protein [Myxococcota bacterium]|nr:rhodanese-like domain-containing protein [Myxococcota bacterium]MDW8363465.1 rhodanese-like domain-containing protein [Myxococcales bacterium]